MLAAERAKVMALKRAGQDKAAEKAAAKPANAKQSKKKKAAEPPPPAPFSLRAALALQMHAAQEALASPVGETAVHQTRIALKRMRVLAHFADRALPEGGAAVEFAAQAAMKRLAAARDLAAIEHAARAVLKKASGGARTFLVRTANEFARTRVAAEATALAETAAALARLAPIVAAAPEVGPAEIERAARALVRRARSAYKQARDSRAVLLRHAWRKREKDRRYAALLLGEAWPRRAHKKLEAKLTEALGRERDAGLLLARLRANPHTPRGAIKLVKAYRRGRAGRADELGARLYRR